MLDKQTVAHLKTGIDQAIATQGMCCSKEAVFQCFKLKNHFALLLQYRTQHVAMVTESGRRIRSRESLPPLLGLLSFGACSTKSRESETIQQSQHTEKTKCGMPTLGTPKNKKFLLIHQFSSCTIRCSCCSRRGAVTPCAVSQKFFNSSREFN